MGLGPFGGLLVRAPDLDRTSSRFNVALGGADARTDEPFNLRPVCNGDARGRRRDRCEIGRSQIPKFATHEQLIEASHWRTRLILPVFQILRSNL